MLTEDKIEQLIEPLINRQRSINMYVIRTLAVRINKIGKLSPSDAYALARVYKSGANAQKITKEIARLTGLQIRDIKRLIKEVAKDAYKDAKPYYDYRQRAYIPYDENTELKRAVNAVATRTAGDYSNLAKATAIGFLIRDKRNPVKLRFQPIGQVYNDVVDEAVQAVQLGVTDYSTAMRRTLEQLNTSGVRRLYYESGYTQRLDTAVRRNLLDGVRAVNQTVQDITGKQFNADGKEITVHANSAPDHEPIQGHQFTNEEFEKLQNAEAFEDTAHRQFAPIQRAIGTLNCMHLVYSIVLGVSKPLYTDKQLEAFKESNAKGIMYNGKHMTMYECTQMQRQMETKIRRLKDGVEIAEVAGDEKLAEKYNAQYKNALNAYYDFSKYCKLRVKLNRI